MRKLGLFILAIVVVVILVISSFACTPQQPQKGPEISLGAVQSLTGMYAQIGTGDSFGQNAAVEDINKQGGLNVGGTKMFVKLKTLDDESDPLKKASLYESLILENKVQFLVGGGPPPTHVGACSVADRYKIIYAMCPGPYEAWLAMRQATESKWPYTWGMGFAIAASPEPGYSVTGVWMDVLMQIADQTNRKMAFLATDDPDGRSWYMGLGPVLNQLGLEVVGFENNVGLLPMETNDFSSVIKAWKDNDCQIFWAACPAQFFGTAWKQSNTLGFKPKQVCVSRGAMFYEDVNAWGGDLANGIMNEVYWFPSFQDCPGIGGQTPASLNEKWIKETGQQPHLGTGPGYRTIQTLADAIERAGSLDTEKVMAALAATDLKTIDGPVKFNENQFSIGPVVMGQWFKTDKPYKWELEIIDSKISWIPATAKPLFPIPYD